MSEFVKWWRAGLCVDDEIQRKNNEREEAYARDGWNAALSAAKAKMPAAPFPATTLVEATRGYAIMYCQKVLDALKESP